MNRPLLGLLAGGLLLCSAGVSSVQEPLDRFKRITPQEAGYDPASLDALRDILVESGSHSLLLLHDGRVFFEHGDIHQPLFAHSMRKALLNGLVGQAWGAGLIDLDATLDTLDLGAYGIELTKEEASATLADVLKSRSGVYLPAAAETEGMAAQRPKRGSHPPGTHFYYNNWDFNVAGALYEQLTDRAIFDAFARDIATPLGMTWGGRTITLELPRDEDFEDFDRFDGAYQFEREQSPFPAYHFRISAHDLALYGQLMLQRGAWQGEQLIPAEWVDRSTQPWSVRNAEYGLAYGMLWYVLIPDEDQAAPPSFYHTGIGVHMLGVYPSRKLVMVHRVDTETGSAFSGDDLIQVIRGMHGARVEAPFETSAAAAGTPDETPAN